MDQLEELFKQMQELAGVGLDMIQGAKGAAGGGPAEGGAPPEKGGGPAEGGAPPEKGGGAPPEKGGGAPPEKGGDGGKPPFGR